MTRTISILGATGSVGEQTLDLVRRNRDDWRVVALTANCQVATLAAAAREFGAEIAVVADESCLADLREALDVCALVERAAQIYVYASLLGKVDQLPPDAIEAELAIYRMRRQVAEGL